MHAKLSSMLNRQRTKNRRKLLAINEPCTSNVDTMIATEKLVRTAYDCAKSDVPFSEYTNLINVQALNGVDCGKCSLFRPFLH